MGGSNGATPQQPGAQSKDRPAWPAAAPSCSNHDGGVCALLRRAAIAQGAGRRGSWTCPSPASADWMASMSSSRSCSFEIRSTAESSLRHGVRLARAAVPGARAAPRPRREVARAGRRPRPRPRHPNQGAPSDDVSSQSLSGSVAESARSASTGAMMMSGAASAGSRWGGAGPAGGSNPSVTAGTGSPDTTDHPCAKATTTGAGTLLEAARGRRHSISPLLGARQLHAVGQPGSNL